ncbi:MAG: SDR family NAD(P)-dependent oxidoreductase [Nocardiopsis sp. BM-2018]|nr:MAG: SDR family NAD(P)-dependent oxidoreductase [Nocardiopsis sp. BM-2018]
MTRTMSALVTGAGGALAAAVIARLEAAAWRPVLLDRLPVDALRERYPDRLVGRADLTDEADTRAEVARLAREADGLDAVLNLAGGFAMTNAADVTLADLQKQLALNLITTVSTTTAALPGMLERGHGVVVGIAAGQAVDGGAKVAPYAAAKAGVVAYLRSLDKELAAAGVRTIVVYPMGTLDTPANRDAMPDADPALWIDTGALADAIVHGLTLGPRARLTHLKVYPDAR